MVRYCNILGTLTVTKACLPTPSRLFPVLPERGGVLMCKLGEALNANDDK